MQKTKIMKLFQGTGVAIVTPFTNDKSVDYKALEKLVNHLIDGGINYLVVQGTTGESVTLTQQEKAEVLSFIVKVNQKRLPIVLGIGGNCTQTLVTTLNTTDLTGVDAILSVSPYYNKPTQEGIYQHYKAVSEASSLPIILYNVPGRTSSNILPSTTLRLARDFENIIAIKEASGNLEQCMTIIQDKPKDFLVISGDDALVLPFMACGGDGVISVIANAYPQGFSDMTKAALQGDYQKAKELHYHHYKLIHYLFVEGNPAGIKTVLNMLNITGVDVRLPLVNVSESTKNALQNLVNQIQ